MPEIAGAVQHGVRPANPARKQHPVSVQVSDIGVDQFETVKILRPGQADRRGMPAPGTVGVMAPGHVIHAVDRRNPRVVLEPAVVVHVRSVRVLALKHHRRRLDLPGQSVIAEPGMQSRFHPYGIHPEHAREPGSKRDHRAVEDGVGGRHGRRRDDRIVFVAAKHRFVGHGILLDAPGPMDFGQHYRIIRCVRNSPGLRAPTMPVTGKPL